MTPPPRIRSENPMSSTLLKALIALVAVASVGLGTHFLIRAVIAMHS